METINILNYREGSLITDYFIYIDSRHTLKVKWLKSNPKSNPVSPNIY